MSLPRAEPDSVPGLARESKPLSLWRTSSLSAIAVAVRIATGFAILKAVALASGPAGLALLGQVGNAAAILSTFAAGGINAGITKYIAEHRTDSALVGRLVRTSAVTALTVAVCIGLMVISLSSQLAELLLHERAYAPVFVLLGASAIPIALNTMLAAALNGNHQIRQLVGLNIMGSLLSLAITLWMIRRWGLAGALYAFAVSQIAVLGITAIVAMQTGWWMRLRERAEFDRDIAVRLTRYGLMALTTAMTLPVSHILVRNRLGDAISWEAAGQWQGMWQISDGYLLLVTTSLSMYYLPRLSELQQPQELRHEIVRGLRIWVPLTSIAALMIYLMRDVLIGILFSPSFSPMRELFAFQLVGDVLKIASWLLSYLMVAKAMSRRFIATEILFSASFVVLSFAFISRFGLVGVTYAFAANYLLYLLTMGWMFRRELGCV